MQSQFLKHYYLNQTEILCFGLVPHLEPQHWHYPDETGLFTVRSVGIITQKTALLSSADYVTSVNPYISLIRLFYNYSFRHAYQNAPTDNAMCVYGSGGETPRFHAYWMHEARGWTMNRPNISAGNLQLVPYWQRRACRQGRQNLFFGFLLNENQFRSSVVHNITVLWTYYAIMKMANSGNLSRWRHDIYCAIILVFI